MRKNCLKYFLVQLVEKFAPEFQSEGACQKRLPGVFFLEIREPPSADFASVWTEIVVEIKGALLEGHGGFAECFQQLYEPAGAAPANYLPWTQADFWREKKRAQTLADPQGSRTVGCPTNFLLF